MTNPDYRALCADLLAAIQLYTKLNPVAIDMTAFELTKKLMDAMAATAAALAEPEAEGPTIPNAKLHYLELTPCEVKRLIEALDFAIGDTVTRPNTGNHHAVRAKLKRSTPEATND